MLVKQRPTTVDSARNGELSTTLGWRVWGRIVAAICGKYTPPRDPATIVQRASFVNVLQNITKYVRTQSGESNGAAASPNGYTSLVRLAVCLVAHAADLDALAFGVALPALVCGGAPGRDCLSGLCPPSPPTLR